MTWLEVYYWSIPLALVLGVVMNGPLADPEELFITVAMAACPLVNSILSVGAIIAGCLWMLMRWDHWKQAALERVFNKEQRDVDSH